jgi:hypothetical protein
MNKNVLLEEYVRRVNEAKAELKKKELEISELEELRQKDIDELEESKKNLDKIKVDIEKKKKELSGLQKKTLSKYKNDIQGVVNELDSKIDELTERMEYVKLDLNKSMKSASGKSYILQMEDGTYDIASKDDIEIVTDLDVIKKAFSNQVSFIQLCFDDVSEEKYKELQDTNWCPFNDLKDNLSYAILRVYNPEEDEFVQLKMDIQEEYLDDAKKLYKECESFWIEPNSKEDKYSYMALIWNGNVNGESD